MTEKSSDAEKQSRSLAKINTTPPEALVVNCSDPRFQEAFRAFALDQLGLRNYAPLIIGGSIHPYGAKDGFADHLSALQEQIKFFVDEAKLKRVIIINHQDCLWYRVWGERKAIPSDPEKAKVDLRTAAVSLSHYLGDVKVEAYWAALDGDEVTFHSVSK